MKPFKTYITEAKTIIRFLAKNPHLSDEEKKKVNDFFTKNKRASQKYERKWGWQSKHPRQMKWTDFQSIMTDYILGRKMLLKTTKIPGSKGKDYWTIRLSKAKDFIANIPLTWDVAKYMNSCKYGTINVNYCIGFKDDKDYWNSQVLQEGQTPVYVTDGVDKWVVMIQSNHKDFEVWDKLNSLDTHTRNKESIPGFSIKRELIGGKMTKLYEEIWHDFYEQDEDALKYSEDEYEDAVAEYLELRDDIRNDVWKLASSEEEWDSYVYEIKNKTIEAIDELIEDNDDEIENTESEEDKRELRKHSTGLTFYKEEIDDVYEPEEIEMLQSNYEKKYPGMEFPLVGEILDHDLFSTDTSFGGVGGYTTLIKVLHLQTGSDINIIKTTDKIHEFISESTFECAHENRCPQDNDVESFLDDLKIFHPEYHEEYYT